VREAGRARCLRDINNSLELIAAIPGQKEAQARVFSMQELQNIVAPVALYPDALLSNVLVASTVPDEVVQAKYYLYDNGGRISSMPPTDWEPYDTILIFIC
jgi:hypothetical protein